jgi:hypothetical protein
VIRLPHAEAGEEKRIAAEDLRVLRATVFVAPQMDAGLAGGQILF